MVLAIWAQHFRNRGLIVVAQNTNDMVSMAFVLLLSYCFKERNTDIYAFDMRSVLVASVAVKNGCESSNGLYNE